MPSGIYRIFDIPENDMEDGKLSEGEVSDVFQGNFTVHQDANSVPVVTQTGTDDGGGNSLVIGEPIDWCEWVMVRTVKAYEEHIMVNLEGYLIGSSTVELWNMEMENAIRDCESDPCTKCPDSRCVITTFANDPSIIGAGLKSEIYVEYLRLLLDLSQEQVDWLLDNPDVLNSLLEDYELDFNGGDGVEDRNDECIAGNCGVPRADRLYIELLMAGETLSTGDRANLESFYNVLFCEDPELYEVLDYVIIEYVNGCIDEDEVLECFRSEFLVNFSADDASPIRFAVAAYRICKRAWKVYKKLLDNNQLTLQKFKNGITDAGIDEILEIADALYTVFGSGFTPWDRVVAAVELVTGLDVSKKNAITQKVTAWGNQSVGSYYLSNFRKKADDTFDGIYVGKGKKSRMDDSAIERGNKNSSYHEGPGQHTKGYWEFGVDKSPNDAAFKEEWIQQWSEGWNPLLPPSQQPSKFYNGATSPGFSKINQDGF